MADITDLNNRRPEYIQGIPVEFFTADTYNFFYRLGYRSSIFERLRGSGTDAVIESRFDAEKHDGFIRLYTRRRQLDTDIVAYAGGIDVSDTRERLSEVATSIEAKVMRKQTFFEEKMVAEIASRYDSIENAGKLELSEWMHRRIDEALCKSLTSNYDGGNGHIPLASRVVCGATPSLYTYGNKSLATALVDAIPGDVNADAQYTKYSMNVAHIRELRRYALSNPYGAEDLNYATIEEGHFVDYPTFYLIMDTDAAYALKQDPEYKAMHINIGRALGEGQGSALRHSQYLGRIEDIECYQVLDLDRIKYKKKRPGLTTVASDAISWSFLLGAGAIGECVGGVRFIEDEDNKNQTVYHTLQYIHGCDALKFPIAGTRIKEKVGNDSLFTFFAGNPALKPYSNIEQGIIHSFTINRQIANWTAEDA